MAETGPRKDNPPVRLIQGSAGGFFSRLFGTDPEGLDLRTLNHEALLDDAGRAVLFESPDVAVAATLQTSRRVDWPTAIVVAPDFRDIDPAQQEFALLFAREILIDRAFDTVHFLQFEDRQRLDDTELEMMRMPPPAMSAVPLEPPARGNGTVPTVTALFDGAAEHEDDMLAALSGLAGDGRAVLRIVARDDGAIAEARRFGDRIHVIDGRTVAPNWIVARTDVLAHGGRHNWMSPFLALAERRRLPVREADGAAGRLAIARLIENWDPDALNTVGGADVAPHAAADWIAELLHRIDAERAA